MNKVRQCDGYGYVILLFLCCFVIPFTGITAVNAAENEKRIVRVGYPQQDGLTEVNDKGIYSGYSYEYLMEISKYTDWTYEFVTVEGTQDEQIKTLMEMLLEGKIDIMGAMVYNDALTRQMDYSGYNYGTAYSILAALDGNTQMTSENYYTFSVIRAAVISSKETPDEGLEQFARTNGFTVKQIFCKSPQEQIALMEEGKADVLLAKDINLGLKGLNIIARFSPIPFYFATTKGNKEIVQELNQALSTIAKVNPYFQQSLKEKYFDFQSENITLTEEEQQYIESRGVINVTALAQKAPIQYMDGDGVPRGISIDLLKYIEEETGLKFHIQLMESFHEYEDYVLSGEADMIAGVSNEMQQYEWQHLNTTNPYLDAGISIIINSKWKFSEFSGKRLAMVRGHIYNGAYEGEIEYYNTTKEAVEAVHKGKADYCYINDYSAQYYTSKPEWGNLVTTFNYSGWRQKFTFGILDKDDSKLCSILNKVIWKAEKTQLIQKFLYENTYQPEPVTLLAYLKANKVQAAVIAGSFTLVLIFAILFISRIHREKEVVQRLLETQRYQQLSELTNEFLFEYNVEQDILKIPKAESLGFCGRIENLSMVQSDNLLIQYVQEKKSGVREMKLFCYETEERWIRVITRVIQGKDGNPLYILGKLVDIQEERMEKEQLLNRAEKDSLTGVYNATTMKKYVGEQMSKAKPGECCAFAILDVDKFKNINDLYGHYVGDKVLEAVGAVLRQLFGQGEFAGRLGGDEFAVFMKCDGNEEIGKRCEQLQQLVNQIKTEGLESVITVSIGASIVSEAPDFDQLYQNADRALYYVKENGRAGYKVYREKTKD